MTVKSSNSVTVSCPACEFASVGGGRYWSLNIRNSKGERRRFDVGDEPIACRGETASRNTKTGDKTGGGPDWRASRGQAASKGREGRNRNVRQRHKRLLRRGMGRRCGRRVSRSAHIRHVFVKHLDRAATDITVQELQLAADAHPSASSASRAITYLKPMARWAAKRGLMQRGFLRAGKARRAEHRRRWAHCARPRYPRTGAAWARSGASPPGRPFNALDSCPTGRSLFGDVERIRS